MSAMEAVAVVAAEVVVAEVLQRALLECLM